MFSIENEMIKVDIKNQGAELCSIIRKEDEKEYIWQAEEAYWKRHAPILFPIVGSLNSKRSIKMGRHGFARDQEFECISESKDALTFELRYTTSTLEVYPFKFVLRIKYSLEASTLHIHYEVSNLGEEPMPFSIGAHPAFNCDLAGGAVTLEFEKTETLDTLLLDLNSGLLNGERKRMNMSDKSLSISLDTFSADALVFKNINSNWIKVQDPSTNTAFKVHFEGFPYMGIWSPKAPFVCIEPWYGVTDTVTDSGALTQKEAIEILEPTAVFRANHAIEIL